MDTTVSDPLIGRQLDGRYRIDGRIARGGMATVYTALDLRLDRTVAVKVMHGALADDEEFVARFIREAKAAARLSHPNVVSVYDQGEDAGHVFLVMEYVPGRTLRDLLRDRGWLSPPQALSILEPVLAALNAAHDAGLVHRDVKPENVLLADDGRVKVADFGLARAIAASKLTSTTGVLIGTVAYLSPEQVEHGVADARSDVYAAGVMLYEMLVGRPPFEGETPLAVAYRHVHDEVPAPSSVGEEIPAELDALVQRATRRNPDERPADAGIFLAEAVRARRALALADPVPGGRAAGDTPVDVRRDDAQRTQVIPRAAATQALAIGEPPPAEPPGTRRRRRKGPIIAIIVLLLALLAGAGGWWYGSGRYTQVPGLLTLDQAAATAKLDKAGLHAKLGAPVFSDTIAKQLVAEISPAAGHRIRRGGTVTLHLSKGPEVYAVPDVAGLTASKATAAIEAAHLRVGDRTEEYSDTVPAGAVIKTDPARGTQLRPDSAVAIVVSKGVQPVDVPDVRGKQQDDATSQLQGLGLKVKITEQYDDKAPKGQVIDQSPFTGQVPKGSTVELVVSKGPQLFAVPNVVGMKKDDAKRALEDAGFKVRVIQIPGPGTVRSQDPGGGSKQRKGTTVTIYVF